MSDRATPTVPAGAVGPVRAGTSGTGPTAGARLDLEDVVPGRVFALGGAILTERDVVAFAREWDPQAFHYDAAVSRRDPARGRFGLRGELATDHGELVMTMMASGRAWLRSPAPAGADGGATA